MIEIQAPDAQGVAEAAVSGRLTTQDYARLAPELEGWLAERGRLRLLIVMGEVTGMDAGALWEDLKFDLSHRGAFERLAVVGDSALAEWGVRFGRLLFDAEIKVFSPREIAAAREWLRA